MRPFLGGEKNPFTQSFEKQLTSELDYWMDVVRQWCECETALLIVMLAENSRKHTYLNKLSMMYL